MGVMERAERCVVLMLGAFTGWLVLALWIVAIGATVTSAQRLLAARRLLAELSRTGRDPTEEPESAGTGEPVSGATGQVRAAGQEG